MANSLQHCGEFNFAAAFFCGSRARRWFANKITVFLGGSEERFTRFFRYFWKWWTIAFVTGGTVPERNGAGIRGRTPLIGMNECITNVLYILWGNYFASRRDEKFISRRYRRRLTLRWKKKCRDIIYAIRILSLIQSLIDTLVHHYEVQCAN